MLRCRSVPDSVRAEKTHQYMTRGFESEEPNIVDYKIRLRTLDFSLYV